MTAGFIAPFCRVDGQACDAPAAPTTPLLDWLRDEVGSTHVRRGCDDGHCGACAVQVDGTAVKSCSLLAAEAAGRDICSAQALANGGSRTAQAVVASLREAGVLQCGYCEAGFVFAAVELLERCPTPDEPQVREAFRGLLCRCGAYHDMVQAVMRAAAQLRAAPETTRPTPALHVPRSIEQARALASQLGAFEWRAGGQALSARGDPPTRPQISLREIEALRQLHLADGWLHIGAGCTHRDLAESPLLRGRLPALAEMAGAIGDAFLRNRATLGGALFDWAPGHCLPAALIGCEATLVVDGNEIDAQRWFADEKPDMAAPALVHAARLPLPARAYHRSFRPVPGRSPLVSVFVTEQQQGLLRVGLSGLGSRPCRARAVERWLGSDEPLSGLRWNDDAFFEQPDADHRRAVTGHLLTQIRAALRGNPEITHPVPSR